MKDGRDTSFNAAMKEASEKCEPTVMNAERPTYLFFILLDQPENQKVFYIQLVAIWFMLQ